MTASLAGRPFVKMTGGGNDFVVFDNRNGWFPHERGGEIVARLCRRGLGVGADAVLLLEDDEDLDFRMVYFNADGGEAPMCGNGALCIARFARLEGVTDRNVVEFATGSGRFRADVRDPTRPEVTLSLIPPRGLELDVSELAGGRYHRVGFLDTSTPHVVALLDSTEAVEAHDVANEGSRLRHHPRWDPPGTNVNFVALAGPGRLRLRTYERGVEAETLSCGTGSTAAAILCHLWGLVAPPVTVETTGGFPLVVDFTPSSQGSLPADPRMTGDARIVFRGVLDELA